MELNADNSKEDEEKSSVDTFYLFQNVVSRSVLGDFCGYNLRRTDKSFLEGAVMSIARLNASVATVVASSICMENRGGYRLKEYGDAFGKMLEIATKQLIGSIDQFVGYGHRMKQFHLWTE